MDYYLGIDIGTTSSKAVAFSVEGQVIESHSMPYEMVHPQPGWSEQDPDKIFDAVIIVLNEVVNKLAPQLPGFVSFSAAMHSLILVNNRGIPITNCIIWADNRADEVAEKLRASREGKSFYESTGVPIHSMSPLCKLLWLKQNRHQLFTAAFKFIGIKEYVFFKLFNQYCVDTSIASATGLLNIKSLQWDQNILDFIGINNSTLPEVVATKTVFYYDNNYPSLSFQSKIPFIIGASDGALSNLGSGAIDPNSMAITIGTSGAARMAVTAAVTDPQMRTFCYHLKENLYVAGGATNNGAVVLQWLKEKVLGDKGSFENLFSQAQKSPAGSNDLIFLPYILGERAPIWNANANGVFFGLTIQHTKNDLVRAALEGVVYGIYSIVKVLAEQHSVFTVQASGGFAKSSLWVQILADVCNLTINVSETVESSALGAVLLGAESLGIGIKFQNNTSSQFTPDPQNYQVYQKRFNRFEKLYELLKGEMATNDNNS